MADMTSQWRPYREPVHKTLLRTGMIAIIAGGVLAAFWGGPARWPAAVLLALWPSFGGHWIEVWFLNWLRPRLPDARSVQAVARLGVWFAGGVILAQAMTLTATALTSFRPRHWPVWWYGGLGFIAIELVAHLALVLRGRPSFYDGRG